MNIKTLTRLFSIILALGLLGFLSNSQQTLNLENAFPQLTFERPVEFTHAGDGSNRLYVIEQEGRIRVFENSPSTKSADVFLDLKNKVSSEGEMGLLGLAFHPN